MPRSRTRRSGRGRRSGSRSGSRRRSGSRSAPMNALLRATMVRPGRRRTPGVRAFNARAPIGMPMTGNYGRAHRLGSRIRSPRSRFLQEGRQLSRRNPALAAMRLAPTRLLNMSDPYNVDVAEQGNFWPAENLVNSPPYASAYAREGMDIGREHSPIATATLATPETLPRPRGNESGLWESWARARRARMRPLPKR